MEKLLEALGFVVTDENKAKVEAAKKILGENFVAKHRYDEKSQEAKKAAETLKERDKQIDSLKKFEGDKTALEAKVKELQDANKDAEKNYAKSLLEEKTRNAVKRELAGKVYDESVAIGLLDLSKVEINEDGTIKSGFKEQFEFIRKDKAFLFIDDKSKGDGKDGKGGGAKPPFKPAGNPPADGSDDKPTDAVNFAKNLAAGVKTGQQTSVDGAKHYFGDGAAVGK